MKILNLYLLFGTQFLWAFQTDLVFPWITDNDQFRSEIAIRNPTNEGAVLSLEAVRLGAESPEVASQQLVLNPFGSMTLNASNAFPELAQGGGYAVRLSGDTEFVQAGFVVAATITESGSSPAQANALAAHSATPVLLFNLLPAQAEGFAAPVVYNHGDQTASVTFRAFRDDLVVAKAERTVPAGTSAAEGVNTLFPEIEGDLYVIAEADQPLLGVSFIFNELGEPSMAPAINLETSPKLDDTVLVSTIASDIGIVDGVSIGPDGNIYVSDFLGGQDFNNASGTQILQITPQGEIAVYTDQVVTPIGNAWDSQGNLYVASFTEGNLRRVAPDKSVTVIASGFNGTSGVAVDSQDNVYVAEYNQGRTVNKVTPNGEVTVFVSDPALNGPVGISFDEDDNLYIGNYNDGKVFRVSPDGEMTQIAQVKGPNFFTMGHLTYANGALFATGIGKNQIYRIGLDGKVSLVAGNGAFALTDGPASEAAFAYPNGIAASEDGSRLYISSFAGRVLRMIELQD